MLRVGLDFRVGSMGDRLSGGQQQKVALARAFLKEPPILVLDEATSALDNASQARIQNLLERKWKGRSTVISVVHRLDTLRGYDRIAVLRSGRIVELGSWDELMERKGALYGLVHRAG
jgi:ABC-type multidrug transport system fused ATPase/permease subunit